MNRFTDVQPTYSKRQTQPMASRHHGLSSPPTWPTSLPANRTATSSHQPSYVALTYNLRTASSSQFTGQQRYIAASPLLDNLCSPPRKGSTVHSPQQSPLPAEAASGRHGQWDSWPRTSLQRIVCAWQTLYEQYLIPRPCIVEEV